MSHPFPASPAFPLRSLGTQSLIRKSLPITSLLCEQAPLSTFFQNMYSDLKAKPFERGEER